MLNTATSSHLPKLVDALDKHPSMLQQKLPQQRETDKEKKELPSKSRSAKKKERCSMGDVGSIKGRCMGEFVHHGEQNERLYMVIAILGIDYNLVDGERGCGVNATAYLASSTGQVVCYQRLPHFFVGDPWFFGSCFLFDVDEKEMCSVVTASSIFNMSGVDLVLINTFAWEAIADAGAKVREAMSYFQPVELDFVRVDVKERYMYKLFKEDNDSITIPRMQACFL